jgi:hypothetical protein
VSLAQRKCRFLFRDAGKVRSVGHQIKDTRSEGQKEFDVSDIFSGSWLSQASSTTNYGQTLCGQSLAIRAVRKPLAKFKRKQNQDEMRLPAYCSGEPKQTSAGSCFNR